MSAHSNVRCLEFFSNRRTYIPCDRETTLPSAQDENIKEVVEVLKSAIGCRPREGEEIVLQLQDGWRKKVINFEAFGMRFFMLQPASKETNASTTKPTFGVGI